VYTPPPPMQFPLTLNSSRFFYGVAGYEDVDKRWRHASIAYIYFSENIFKKYVLHYP
jgi:hypothetical protein